MSKLIDLTGKVYGRLKVISIYIRTERRAYLWNCLCDCGNYTIVLGNHLKSGHTKSCGCLSDENRRSRAKHRESNKRTTKEYHAWLHIKGRCHTPSNESYSRYGGRGIIVCNRWRVSYENFLSDMGRAPSKKHSVERIDNNGNYEPSNCKWATDFEQANNKRNSTKLEYKGIIKTIPQWAREYGLKPSLVRKRISSGWSAHEALIMPKLTGGPSIMYYRRIGRVPPQSESKQP